MAAPELCYLTDQSNNCSASASTALNSNIKLKCFPFCDPSVSEFFVNYLPLSWSIWSLQAENAIVGLRQKAGSGIFFCE